MPELDVKPFRLRVRVEVRVRAIDKIRVKVGILFSNTIRVDYIYTSRGVPI